MPLKRLTDVINPSAQPSTSPSFFKYLFLSLRWKSSGILGQSTGNKSMYLQSQQMQRCTKLNIITFFALQQLMLADNDQSSLPFIYRRRLKTISTHTEENNTTHLKYSNFSSIRKNSANGSINRKSSNYVVKNIEPIPSNFNSQLQLYKQRQRMKSLNEPLQHFLQQISKGTMSLQPIQQDKALNKIESSEIYRYYNEFIKGKQMSQEIVTKFAAFLHIFHLLFQKHHLVIIASLLQIGYIQQYSQNDKIYKYNSPIKNIGFVLWGKLILKKYKSKQKYQCRSSDTVGEQIMFQSVNYSNSNDKFVQKGQLLTKQTCRALSHCAILHVSLQKFTIMEEELKKHGFKDIDRFKAIVQRNYLKKKQFRRIKAVIAL